MQFNINEWRKYYNSVHKLGKMLNDGLPDKDGNPPVSALSREARTMLSDEIDRLNKRLSNYFDSCGMALPEPLWLYEADNPKTWASHPDFAYKHLLNKKEKK